MSAVAIDTRPCTEPGELYSSPPPSKKVKWEVEEPSEFRPGVLDNIGKDKEKFRTFNDVNL